MNEKNNKKNNGFIFSIDSVYAIFVILLASMTVITLLNTQNQDNSDVLYLSRIARDIQDVNQSKNGSLDVNEIENQMNVRINDCGNAGVVGTSKAVIYDGSGDLDTRSIEVCPQ